MPKVRMQQVLDGKTQGGLFKAFIRDPGTDEVLAEFDLFHIEPNECVELDLYFVPDQAKKKR